MSIRYDGPSCPAWVKNRRSRPSEYNRLYDELKEFNGTVKADKASLLLQKSGLQSQQLDRIWNLLNNKTGVLSEQEFSILIAFVALSQVCEFSTFIFTCQPENFHNKDKEIGNYMM